jgi:hypothetical protein
MKPSAPYLWILLLCLIALPSARAATPITIGFPLQVALGIRDTIELEFQTEVNKIYQVEVSENLTTWASDGYAIVGTGGPRIHIARSWGKPSLYFRVRNNGDPTRVLAGGVPGPPGPAGPQGVQGPQGQTGTPGLNPADYATAAQGAKADTALQSGYSPIANEAQAFWAALNGTSLRDRFDRPERYAEGQKITNLTSIPEIGPAWKPPFPLPRPALQCILRLR